jgi:hypothetical protein
MNNRTYCNLSSNGVFFFVIKRPVLIEVLSLNNRQEVLSIATFDSLSHIMLDKGFFSLIFNSLTLTI